MQTAVLDNILRQKKASLNKAVRSSLKGEVKKAFEKLEQRLERGPGHSPNH